MTHSFLSDKVRCWLAEPMPHEATQSVERLSRAEDVHHVAVMPDVHLSGDVCIGIVVATKHLLYPAAVGNDIGCGMAAVRLKGDADALADEGAAGRLLAGLYRTAPSIRHPRPTLLDKLPEPLNEVVLSQPALEKRKSRDGRVEFATLGRGNHFIEFQADDEGCLWLMIHSGSRAMGQAIANHHFSRARQSALGFRFLDADSDDGSAYLADLAWAYQYADQSRRAMAAAVSALVLDLFGIEADLDSFITCNHNHVRKETHRGQDFWVHRKGAISAHEDEQAIIPGSMGTASFHVAGRGCEEALCSSSHGAGRQMSRSEAFKRIPIREFCRQMKNVWYDRRLVGKIRDEAPSAYKDIHGVMRAQRELTRIVRILRPILSYKGA